MHNAYRSQLAKGQITNKGGKKLPTGKNIYALVRSPGVASGRLIIVPVFSGTI